jgi:hypothetical protein
MGRYGERSTLLDFAAQVVFSDPSPVIFNRTRALWYHCNIVLVRMRCAQPQVVLWTFGVGGGYVRARLSYKAALRPERRRSFPHATDLNTPSMRRCGVWAVSET